MRLLPAALALLLCGCAGLQPLSQVSTTQAPGQPPKTTSTPLGSGPVVRGPDAVGAGVTLANLLFALQDQPELLGGDMQGLMQDMEMLRSDPFQTEFSTRPLASAPPGPSPYAAPRPPLGLSAGFSYTRIWTRLRTRFLCASAPSLEWDDDPKVTGRGGEAAVLLFGRPHEKVSPIFGEAVLRLGFFESASTAHEGRSGAVFVRERLSANALYGDTNLRVYLLEPAFLSVAAGLFYYRLNTSVDTNAAGFSYEGLSGERVFGMLGFGGGLRTPWKAPLKGLLEGTVFLTTDKALESAVLRLAASLAYYF